MKNIIHRGITSKNIKENSYLAIKKAIKDKESIGVEFDIRLTKDKKIVLSHNSLINLNVIEETNYSELIKNNYLTTLDKILDIDTNKIFLIDIKTNNNYKVFSDILMNTINKYNKNIYLPEVQRNDRRKDLGVHLPPPGVHPLLRPDHLCRRRRHRRRRDP